MKVTLLQTDIVWNDSAANIAKADALVDANAGSDLYVLPEMWATGFNVEPQTMAETEEGPSLIWMRRKASQTGAAIAGSLATMLKDGRYVNRLYFVKPSGDGAFYDKRHLFAFAGEQRYYTAGQERVVVEWKGVRILLQVCYDLRFPVFSRNKNDYDMVLYVASWPEKRQTAWDTLLRARAIENQCFVAGVNRVGDDPHCHYAGATMLVDAYGQQLGTCRRDEEEALTTTVDMEALRSFRRRFPVLEQGEEFSIR